jgi:hypothetical protein
MSVGRLLCASLLAALATAPAAAAADGIDLVAPANGSTVAAGAIGFEWTTNWSDGFEALVVSLDPQFADVVAVRSWDCAPACATATRLTQLGAGAYYWGVGIKLGTGVVHLSEPWSFTVKPRAPYVPPARHRRKHRHRRHP